MPLSFCSITICLKANMSGVDVTQRKWPGIGSIAFDIMLHLSRPMPPYNGSLSLIVMQANPPMPQQGLRIWPPSYFGTTS